MWLLFLVYDEGILISWRHVVTVRREIETPYRSFSFFLISSSV